MTSNLSKVETAFGILLISNLLFFILFLQPYNLEFGKKPKRLKPLEIYLEHALDQKNCSNVIWFYHIAKTGGTTVVSSFQNDEDTIVLQLGKSGTNATFKKNFKDHNTDRYIYPEFYLNRTAKNIFVQQHTSNAGMLESIEFLQNLATDVESSGCRFLLTTVIRNPIDRVKSFIKFNNLDMRAAEDNQKVKLDNGQAKYFLFNNIAASQENEELLKSFTGDEIQNQSIKILKEFDVIGTTENLDKFLRSINSELGSHYFLGNRKRTTKSSESHERIYNSLNLQLDTDEAMYRIASSR